MYENQSIDWLTDINSKIWSYPFPRKLVNQNKNKSNQVDGQAKDHQQVLVIHRSRTTYKCGLKNQTKELKNLLIEYRFANKKLKKLLIFAISTPNKSLRI